MSTFLSDRNLKQWKLFHKMYIQFYVSYNSNIDQLKQVENNV